MQANGSLLTAEQITSWYSAEVKKREDGKISGADRMKSLQNHLDVWTNYKAKHPSSFWKVYDNENKCRLKGATLQAMVYLLEVNGANVKEKREKLKDLNLNEIE